MKRHLARVTAAVKTEGKHANYARKYEKWLKKKNKRGDRHGNNKAHPTPRAKQTFWAKLYKPLKPPKVRIL